MLVLSTNLESNWLNLEYKGRELCMCVKEFKEVKASESCLVSRARAAGQEVVKHCHLLSNISFHPHVFIRMKKCLMETVKFD